MGRVFARPHGHAMWFLTMIIVNGGNDAGRWVAVYVFVKSVFRFINSCSVEAERVGVWCVSIACFAESWNVFPVEGMRICDCVDEGRVGVCWKVDV